MESILEQDGN